MTKHTIQTIIIDDSTGEKCEVHCGVDWSSAENITLARQRIKEKFSDKIRLRYLDLHKPTSSRLAVELNQQIKDKNLPLPVLFINGQPRISGEFDIRLLLDAIDAEVEIDHEQRI